MISQKLRILVVSFAAFASLFLTQRPGAAQTWSNGYGYRRPITIDHTKVPNTDQSNFPVLISGTYSYLATISNGGNVTSNNGYDIIFTSDAAGTTVLPYERESYNYFTGAVLFWVKAPTLSHTTDTVIYMFYGNGAVTTDQSNKTGVWDSNYVGVWHMGDSAANTTVADSTSNNNTVSLTVYNPVITSVSPPAAPVGGSVTLTGSGFTSGTTSSTFVKFNGVDASSGIASWSDTSIAVTVPSGATSGSITVKVYGVTSAGAAFTLGTPAVIGDISPSMAPAGATVTISGSGFGAQQSNSSVIFYATPAASITSWSDTQIQAVVPEGGVSGNVYVIVAGLVTQGPVLTLTSSLSLTDSLGNQTSYKSLQQGAKWLPLQVQGSGCSSCTARGNQNFSYDSAGRVLSRADELGRTTSYTYDSSGNVLTATLPLTSTTSATTTFTYNSFGEVLTTTDPLGNVTTNTYDANGNLLTVTTPAPDGSTAASVTTLTYDTKGELLTIKDPLNHQTTIAYYPTGLIHTITDAQSNVTTYVYDSQGNRTSVTDALSHQTTFTYDTMNRLTKITYPDTTTTQFAYDIRGRRTSVTDQNGKVISENAPSVLGF